MHIWAPCLPFSPLWHRSVGRVVLHHVRSPDRARSVRVVLFEGARISFAKLLLPDGCLMHVRVARFLFSPLWHRSVERVVSQSVRSLDRAHLGRAISFEGVRINFAKL